MPLTPTARWQSVRYAARGVAVVLRTQHNAWLHAIATGVVLAAGFFVGLSQTRVVRDRAGDDGSVDGGGAEHRH